MVAKFATDTSEMSKRRPPGIVSDRVRSEVGTTKSVNAGSIPKSNINTLIINNFHFSPLKDELSQIFEKA